MVLRTSSSLTGEEDECPPRQVSSLHLEDSTSMQLSLYRAFRSKVTSSETLLIIRILGATFTKKAHTTSRMDPFCIVNWKPEGGERSSQHHQTPHLTRHEHHCVQHHTRPQPRTPCLLECFLLVLFPKVSVQTAGSSTCCTRFNTISARVVTVVVATIATTSAEIKHMHHLEIHGRTGDFRDGPGV